LSLRNSISVDLPEPILPSILNTNFILLKRLTVIFLN